MSEIITVELDMAKNVFQVHGTDGAGQAVLRKKLRLAQVLKFLAICPLVSWRWKPVAVLISGAVRSTN